jgi:hypothetical protein
MERPARDIFTPAAAGTPQALSGHALFAFGETLPQVRRNLDVYAYDEKYINKIYTPLEALFRRRATMPYRLLTFLPEAREVLRAIAIHADWQDWADKTQPPVVIGWARDLFEDADIYAMADARERDGRPATALRGIARKVVALRTRL